MSRLATAAGSAASGAALYGRPYRHRGVRVSTSPPPRPHPDPLGVRYDDRAYQVEVEPPPAYVDGWAPNERLTPETLGCADDLIAQALHLDSQGRDDLLRPVLAAMSPQERQTLVSVYRWPAERVETAVGERVPPADADGEGVSSKAPVGASAAPSAVGGEPAADGVTPDRAGGAS